MIIIGGGMAGLLAGVLNPSSTIFEKGPERQATHQAVLRMQRRDLFKLTGIPCEKIIVQKAIWYNGREVQSTPRIAHMYSKKVTGRITGRSVLNIDAETRYIPPNNFLNLLQKKAGKIHYNTEFDFSINRKDSIVSTIPMPVLAKNLEEPLIELFHSSAIYVNRYTIKNCNTHATIYYPDAENHIYRSTLCKNCLIVEAIEPIETEELPMVYDSFGLTPSDVASCDSVSQQRYGKIYDIDEKTRQNFITQMTLKYGIYSLGRFACWRPKTMLDDVVDDIFVIRRLIEQGVYASINHQQGEEK